MTNLSPFQACKQDRCGLCHRPLNRPKWKRWITVPLCKKDDTECFYAWLDVLGYPNTQAFRDMDAELAKEFPEEGVQDSADKV